MAWVCAVLVLIMNTAQAAHLCDLGEELSLIQGKSVNTQTIEPTHTFCTICASAHSPSLAASLVSLPSADAPSETPVAAVHTKPSVSPVFVSYIRPPPAA